MPLGIIEIMEIGVNMELNCAVTEQVVKVLQANNIDCYIVGGYVRDYILGIESKDIDIELHNTTIETAYELVKTVADAKVFGKFGVISLNEYNTEFAIARTEQKTGTSHTDFTVQFINDGNLKLAASRRDFTINSMMYDLQNNLIIDNYGGKSDLEQKILRHVSDAFAEDPLRILRGLKFIARYNLTIEPETDQLCRSIISELKYLPQIRVQKELEAIFAADYYQQARGLLTIYLNLLFNQQLTQYSSTGDSIIANRISFFKQFTNSDVVIDFCYEQKNIKRDLKLVLKNYDQYLNYNELPAIDKYQLLVDSKHVLSYVKYINSEVITAYHHYQQLTKEYDGQYFIKLGISGKEIKNAMAKKIGGMLDEL